MPATRTKDPDTSHAAAASIDTTKLRASQARVLAMFKLYGDLHDKALERYLHDAERAAGMTKLMSPSGIRSRRSELSKPNMNRLGELAREMTGVAVGSRDLTAGDVAGEVSQWVRAFLRREGFRSPLWDTGRREVVDGHRVIVWGLAK